MGEGGGDAREEEQAGEGPPEIATSTGDRDAAHDDGGDHLEFEAGATERLHLGGLGEIHHGGEAGQGTDESKNEKRDELRTNTREARGLGIGADCVNETASG